MDRIHVDKLKEFNKALQELSLASSTLQHIMYLEPNHKNAKAYSDLQNRLLEHSLMVSEYLDRNNLR